METVILLSVLSTLGVVAVVTSVVVMFFKIKDKVGKNTFFTEVKSFHDYIDHIERERKHSVSETNNYINKSYEDLLLNLNNYRDEIDRRFLEIERDFNSDISSLSKIIDSRCDKLDAKIKEHKK